MLTAGAYSATLHYLKAVQAAGTDEAKAVMAKMREMPVNDVMTKNGKLREDGRLVRDMHLFQVKSPAESKSKDDIYKLLATVPGDEAYRRMKDGKCPFIKWRTAADLIGERAPRAPFFFVVCGWKNALARNMGNLPLYDASYMSFGERSTRWTTSKSCAQSVECGKLRRTRIDKMRV